MSDKVKDIAELLPEGMSEDLIAEIAKVMQDVIADRIDEEMGMLTNKVHAFLRHQMDTIQEAAIDELSESNEIYRDAQALKDIKSVLTWDIDREDVKEMADQIGEEVNSAKNDNELLATELSETIRENQRLDRVISNLEGKVSNLNEEKEHLQESLVSLEEEVGSDFESTERAIVITENVDRPVKDTPELSFDGNPFLTEEVMAFMPNSKN